MTMTMTNTQAVRFALMPGEAETLKRKADRSGNLGWWRLAEEIMDSRDILYVGISLTTLAAIGAALSVSRTRQYACPTVATFGAGIATLAAKRLYDATSLLQSYINSGNRP